MTFDRLEDGQYYNVIHFRDVCAGEEEIQKSEEDAKKKPTSPQKKVWGHCPVCPEPVPPPASPFSFSSPLPSSHFCP